LQGDFSIGEWRVQPQINCVQKNGTSMHLEPKVMQVLVLLASNQGDVVSKERLLQTVWSGVFVGEDVLTRSISEIRRVLADDARSPHVIQTIPKTGYRLIAPVTFGGTVTHSSSSQPIPFDPLMDEPPTAPLLVDSSASPRVEASVSGSPVQSRGSSRRFLAIGIGLIVLLLCALLASFFFWFMKSKSRNPSAFYRTVPFTSYPGSEGQAAFSPDGNQIAFVWNGNNQDNKDIYVKIRGTATPLRLTTDPADDLSPTWSPDGRFIAFVRQASNEASIYIVPAIGGAERKLYSLSSPTYWDYGGLAWSNDGKFLIFPDRLSPRVPSSLFSISLDNLTVKRLTWPPNSWDGDWTPSMSPDGRKIAFVRADSSSQDVYVMDASGSPPTRLTDDNRLVVGLTWTTDSRNVVFSSNRDGNFSLWKVPATGGALERVAAGGQNSYSPAISRRGDMLAYSYGSGRWDIERINLKAPAPKTTPERLLSSDEQDAAPQFSPDGTRIAFQSWRSGAQEIWVCAADGSALSQLTSFGGALSGSPSWSPDGRKIAFDARPNGRAHIYVMSPDGGVPKALTNGNDNDVVPSWSPDGKWVYFGSNRSGSWQIWKMESTGGTPKQVTTQGGMVGRISPDGSWVYYTKPEIAGLWRIPAQGGSEEQILKDPPNGFQAYWGLTKNGIYFLDTASDQKSIAFVSYSALNRTIHVKTLDHAPTFFSGLSVSPDGHWLVYAEMAEANSNINLVENFQMK
jgi:Tol biopolymer transport system component/DNA-binding winged helix-turn-helix (wHTH) protein